MGGGVPLSQNEPVEESTPTLFSPPQFAGIPEELAIILLNSNYPENYSLVAQDDNTFMLFDGNGRPLGQYILNENGDWIWIPNNLLFRGASFPWWLMLIFLPFIFFLVWYRKKKVTYITGVDDEAYIQIVKHGAKLTLPNVFRTRGNSIESWYISQDFTRFENQWDFEEYKVNKDLTLYAKWHDTNTAEQDFDKDLAESLLAEINSKCDKG